jgi:F1F0 ATPase subunit 2
MSESLKLILALPAGMLLGALFFGGLWWTVQRSLLSAQPAILILGSFLLRTVVTLAGFRVALLGGWQALAACMIGFLIARVVVTRIVRQPRADKAERIGRAAS